MAFLVLVIVSLLSFVNLEMGIDTNTVVPDNSYVIVHNTAYNKHWPGKRILGMAVVLKDVDFSDPEELATCCFENHTHVVSTEGTLFKWLEDKPDVHGSIGGSSPSWLEAHLNALNGMGLDPSDPAVFYGYLSATIGTTPYAGSITCADGNLLKDGGDCTGGIDVSEFTIMFAIEDDTMKVHEVAQEINSDGKDLDHHLAGKATGYVYHQFFCYGAMDAAIPGATLSTLLWALGAVLISLAVALDFKSAIVSGVIVGMIDIELVALMTIWDIKLAGPSFVCLVMSVGLSVDYCVHICHGYIHGGGGSPVEKMEAGIKMMGGAVLKGASTTFLGVLVLSGASSTIFRMFFKLLFGTVLCGVIHGLFLAPILLMALDTGLRTMGIGGGDAHKVAGH